MTGKDTDHKRKYPPVSAKDVIIYLWRGIKKNSLFLYSALFFIALASTADIFTPIYYKRFIDTVTSSHDRLQASPLLIKIILMILLVNSLSWIMWRIGSFANVTFQAKSMASLRQQAYDYLIHHSFSFFSNNFSGAIVQRVGRYARAFERLADRISWNIVPLAVRLTGIVIVISSVEAKLAAVIVLWALSYMIVNYVYSVWRLKSNIKMAEADSKTTAVLADSITNQNNIEIFSRHEAEKANFQAVTDAQMKITRANWNMNLILDAIQSGLITLIEFAIFYFAIELWRAGTLTVGTFVLLQLYVIGMGGQLWDFGRIVRDFYEGFADAKELIEIMKLPYEIKDSPLARPLSVERGRVEFKDVNFSFSQTKEVLKNISFEIEPGKKLGLVGPSGAGKTTIVRLLLRFYDVKSGSILIDGCEAKNVTLKSLRENIGFVPQDPMLFHRTIMENIRYGRPDAADTEVFEAARLAHCDEFIEALPAKYQTFVGERGIKLSGGERQRVAIARALLKNAPILVLDEATSSLDSHSESLIQDALETLMKNKTVIVIAHRLSTIRKMDKIIVLKEGRILEQGTHISLIDSESFYKKLWTLQAGGFIK